MMGVRRKSTPIAGEAAMNYTLSPLSPFVLQEFRLHLDGASATLEDFSVDLVSRQGTPFNVKLYKKDMDGVQDAIYIPTRPQEFQDGDSIRFIWPNSNGRLWGLEIIYDA